MTEQNNTKVIMNHNGTRSYQFQIKKCDTYRDRNRLTKGQADEVTKTDETRSHFYYHILLVIDKYVETQ
jgi:hypothetical protein